jgi:hypothetical protein
VLSVIGGLVALDAPYPYRQPDRLLMSSRGRVLDHIAVVYPDVLAALDRFSQSA